jgi:hypothetical protein
MFDQVRKEWAREPDRSVVDAAHEFLPATPLDPDYLEWLATQSERLPQRPPSYFDPRPRWAAYTLPRRTS